MRFGAVRLHAPAASAAALAAFYDALGLGHDGAALLVGETRLELASAAGAPFYHVALLAPGDRFDELLAWARGRVELLPERGGGEVVFDFTAWDARACYFHDPAGNIVELIAHRGIGERSRRGAFDAAELIGVSEVGLVGDKAALAARLSEHGVDVWSGTIEGDGLAFAGERGRTLILCPPRRPWLPTGRPAEPHPVEVAFDGATLRFG